MSETQFRTPGQLIKHLLSERKWTQEILATILDVDKTIVSKIIAGTRSVDAQLALELGEVFEEDAEKFMDLQLTFDLAHARIVSIPDPGRANRAHLFSSVPIKEMMKRGWIRESRIKNVAEIEDSLTKFFGVEKVADIEVLPHAAKKTNVGAEVTGIQTAWLYRVKSIASEMLVPPFSKPKARAAIKKLSELRYAPEEARNVPKILAESGIRFLIVESLEGAKIDGVCFWLDDSSPVIALSLRFDRIDNFWFVLRHELEHVLRGDGKETIVIDDNLDGVKGGTSGEIPEAEKVANIAGAEFCVSQVMLEKFIRRKAPVFSERDLLGFAKMQNVHPGLIAGQIQRHTGRYELFRKHLVPVRKHVSPGSTVDGWGDIQPVD